MDIFEMNQVLNKVYPKGYKMVMREDGDVTIYVHDVNQWLIKDAWDTLAEFNDFLYRHRS